MAHQIKSRHRLLSPLSQPKHCLPPTLAQQALTGKPRRGLQTHSYARTSERMNRYKPHRLNPYLAGAIGGTLATAPMTVAMELLFRRLPPGQQYPLPPRELTMAIANRTGFAPMMPSERARVGATLAAHFGYGLFAGALYPLTFFRRQPRHPLLHGSFYGIVVWALSYLGWVPALKILKPANQHPRQRRWLMIVVHLLWGAVTAGVTLALSNNGAQDSGRSKPHKKPQLSGLQELAATRKIRGF
jgi:hypothetical protein